MIYICLIIVVLIMIVTFFAGRLYELFAGQKRRYNREYMAYQRKLLLNCEKENIKNDIFLDSIFVNNQYKRIVIYGIRGENYTKFRERCREEFFDAIYLADSYADDLRDAFDEPIYNKQQMKDLEFDAIVVTSVIHFSEIDKDLRAMGISEVIWSYRDIVLNAAKEYV